MQFTEVFTEQAYRQHLEWLEDSSKGSQLKLSRADLRGANLSRADLREADLNEADLSGADLSGADLSGADLSGADLSGANLNGADLSRANLNGADLSWANLSGANLSRANLSRANLSGANLSRANLRGANLSRADLREADLNEADLNGAIGNNKEIISIQTGIYLVAMTHSVIAIGCKQFSYEQWIEFSEDRIKELDGSKAIEFYKNWKPIIEQIYKLNFLVDSENSCADSEWKTPPGNVADAII